MNPGPAHPGFAALLGIACATTQEYPQPAHDLGIEIAAARVTSTCADIDVELVNRGKRPAYTILAGDSPFFDLITSAYSDSRDLRHVRISFAERPPLGIVFHPKLPEQILVLPHSRLAFRIKLPLPLNEGFSQSAKYTEHGSPPPEKLAHVVRSLAPPFWIRVNVGVVAEPVDVTSHSIIPLQAIDDVLRRQYLAESPSLLLSPGAHPPANAEPCDPVVDLATIHKKPPS